MKISKKFTLSFLASTALLSNSLVLDLDTLVKPNVSFATQALSNENSNANFKSDDSVKIIVKLKENQVSPDDLNSEEKIAARQEATKPVREEALEKISDAGIEYNKLLEYDLLFNGFSLETSYANAKKIQDLDFVDSVELNVSYEKPVTPATTEEAEENIVPDYLKNKSVIDSNKLINIEPLWEKNIMGQGMVVSIIDSGLDLEHDTLRISDPSKAKYKNEAEFNAVLEESGITYGRWYSDKVIFAYNYADLNNDIKEEAEHSHGMHVAGTSVGNPSERSKNGEYITGVAPEAQLIFMRVFSDKVQKGSTDSYLYVKAIEDSVKLGADVINMSLGGATGSTTDVGKAVAGAINLAKNMGVTVVIAAGNDSTFGNSYSNPLAKNPDYGLVANPSVAEDSISVAALGNTVINTEVLNVKQLEGNKEFNNGKIEISAPATPFDPNLDYDYEYVNLGETKDFEGKNLTGKIALIERGAITFGQKVHNAKEAGAVGVVIFNHVNGGDSTISMNLEHNGKNLGKDFPVTSIGHTIGKELAKNAGTYKLSFDGSISKFDNPGANMLTDFTSWGLSNDGNLKPDVTAPGGSIYSSINNGKYTNMDGTSMASPHTAGAVALVKQSILAKFPDIRGEELQKLIKHLIMSTAVPNFNKETNAYTSPRQQGAGVIDTYKATTTNLYLTGDNDYGSITLGNVEETFTFNVQVHNIGNEDKELTYITHLNTDEVKDGVFTLKPRELGKIPGDRITVPANSTITVPITISSALYTKDLDKTMPNGYYLEGFVRFVDSSNEDVVSIPFVGFKGAFQDLPVLEKPIYEFGEDEKPFYFYKNPNSDSLEVDDDQNFTALMTVANELDLASYSVVPKIRVLGELPDYANLDFETRVINKDKLVFSPNGDKDRDDIGLRGVFFRNFENMQLNVYYLDDTKQENPLYTSPYSSGAKNYFSGRGPKSTLVQSTIWNGTDNDGNPLPDGKYQYVITYKPDAAGAKTQTTSFVVELDRQLPIIAGGYYDEANRKFYPHEIIEKGSGLAFSGVLYDDDHTDKANFLPKNEDGSYTIPEGKELKDYWVRAVDFAGNEDSQRLDNLNIGNHGLIDITLLVGNEATDYKDFARYTIYDEDGKVVYGEEESRIVGLDDQKNPLRENLKKLPFGKYTVEVTLITDELKLLSPRQVEVELSKENSLVKVNFLSEQISENKLSVRFDNVLPHGAKVYAVSKDGEKFELPQSKYLNTVYEKRLENGDYTVVIELPNEDYSVSENNFDVTVVNGDNIKIISVSKVVSEKPENAPTAEDKPIYDLNADNDEDGFTNEAELVAGTDPENAESKPESSEANNNEEADESANETEDNSTEEASTREEVNFDSLKEELEQSKETQKDDKFVYGNEKDKLAYVATLNKAEELLNSENATQNDVDALVNRLKELREGFDGVKPVQKDELEEELAKVVDTQNSDPYNFDSEEDKLAYVDSVNKARELLDNKDASQEDIDKLVAKLKELREGFDGEKPDESDNNKDEETKPEKSDSNKEDDKNEESNKSENNAKTEDSNKSEKDVNSEVNSNSENDNKAEVNNNSEKVNKEKLQKEVDKFTKLDKKDLYVNYNSELKEAYLRALFEAQEVLGNKEATQADVDNALDNLKDAYNNLVNSNSEKPKNPKVTPKNPKFTTSPGVKTPKTPGKKLTDNVNNKGKGNNNKNATSLKSYANDNNVATGTPKAINNLKSSKGLLANTGEVLKSYASVIALLGLSLVLLFVLKRKNKNNR